MELLVRFKKENKLYETKNVFLLDTNTFLRKEFITKNLLILFISLGSKAIDGEIKPRELSVIDPVGK